MKDYKEYPSALPGVFEISIEDFRHQFSIPESYTKTDIERRALKPARESINSIPECDFTFEYEAKKDAGKFVGFKFEIKKKKYIDSKATEIIEIEEKDPLESNIGQTASMLGFAFEPEEIKKIYLCARRENKDIQYVMQILMSFKNHIEDEKSEPVKDSVAYLCRMIQDGTNSKPNKTKSNFNNFSQREYDMDELERKLLDQNRSSN